MFLSLFQTASGSLHYPSILTAASWFFGSVVSGIFIFSLLIANRAERLKSFAKEEQYRAELADARKQIAGFEIRPFTIRLKELINEIDPGILSNPKNGNSYIKIYMNQSQHTRLQNLNSEKESGTYITIMPMEEKFIEIADNSFNAKYGVTIRFDPKLITANTKKKHK